MFNYVRLSDGGPRRHDGPRSEVEVIADLAERVRTKQAERNASPQLAAIDWRSMRDTGAIRQAIAKVIPGFEAIGEIDRTKQEFQITGRVFHDYRFPTPDGRVKLHAHTLPELAGTAADEIRVMTIRSEGQFNTVVYEDYDLYRGIDARDVILLHPDDCARLGVKPEERMTIVGPAGKMFGIRVVAFPDLRPGNAAMYYPECNVLVSRELDPRSKTPAFKCVVCRLEKP
jgi:anaerobic selenocysteine-containing dehydrogenase